jgi:hypothetical protein
MTVVTTGHSDFWEVVLLAIAEGESLRSICKEVGKDPKEFYRAMFKDEDLCQRYMRAKNASTHAKVELIEDLRTADPKTIVDDRGIERIDPAWVNLQRLCIDTIKWEAAKQMPKRYGDSSSIEHSGEIKTSLIPIFANREAADGGR